MNKKVILPIILFGAFAMHSMTSCTSNSGNEQESEETQDTTEVEAVPEESATEPKGVDFSNLKDGDVVSSPLALLFEVSGMEIEPAGEVREGYGHHHIIINDGAFLEAGRVIVADDTHIHYGKGQTADTLDLEPGEYQLTLQFADGLHQSYGEEWAKSVNITVE